MLQMVLSAVGEGAFRAACPWLTSSSIPLRSERKAQKSKRYKPPEGWYASGLQGEVMAGGDRSFCPV